jgi:hypothetical protein
VQKEQTTNTKISGNFNVPLPLGPTKTKVYPINKGGRGGSEMLSAKSVDKRK